MTDKRKEIEQFYSKKFNSKSYGRDAVYLNPDPYHYHQKIISLILGEGKGKKLKVLDVGCASGYLGAEIKLLGHYVAGIEIAPNAAEQASKVIDRVFTGDAQEIENLGIKDKFDIIICSDILEHLFDPAALLRKLPDYLLDGGKILVVLPNVGWYRLRLMLLLGKWHYAESGILDFGHIRWFSRSSAIKILNECGFRVEKTIPWLVYPIPLSWFDYLTGRILSRLCFGPKTLFAQEFLYIALPV